MSPELRRNDYKYGIRPNAAERVGTAPMGIARRSIAAATISSETDATAWFASNFTGGTLKPPFNVRTETAANNAGYFIFRGQLMDIRIERDPGGVVRLARAVH